MQSAFKIHGHHPTVCIQKVGGGTWASVLFLRLPMRFSFVARIEKHSIIWDPFIILIKCSVVVVLAIKLPQCTNCNFLCI